LQDARFDFDDPEYEPKRKQLREKLLVAKKSSEQKRKNNLSTGDDDDDTIVDGYSAALREEREKSLEKRRDRLMQDCGSQIRQSTDRSPDELKKLHEKKKMNALKAHDDINDRVFILAAVNEALTGGRWHADVDVHIRTILSYAFLTGIHVSTHVSTVSSFGWETFHHRRHLALDNSYHGRCSAHPPSRPRCLSPSAQTLSLSSCVGISTEEAATKSTEKPTKSTRTCSESIFDYIVHAQLPSWGVDETIDSRCSAFNKKAKETWEAKRTRLGKTAEAEKKARKAENRDREKARRRSSR